MNDINLNRTDTNRHGFIKSYYAYHLFANLAFWLPIYAVFFLDRNLALSSILILYAVKNACQISLELPSGLLADKWGRKYVLALGVLLQIASLLVLVFGNTFLWYVLGMVMFGSAHAFFSGTDSAFIFDSLKSVGRENEFGRIEGRAYMFNLIGWGVGGLLGGFAAVHSLSLPYILSAFASIIAFIAILSCSEPPHIKSQSSAFRLFKDALRFTALNTNIRAIIIMSSVIFGLLLVTHQFSQPYLLRANINLEFFGVIYFVWLIGAAISSNYSQRIIDGIGCRIFFFIVPITTSIAVLYMGLWQNYWGPVIILLHQFSWGALRPQMNRIINRETESSMRATILSLAGFGSSIIYIVCGPLAGLYADKYDFPASLTIVGLIILVAGLISAFFVSKAERKVTLYK